MANVLHLRPHKLMKMYGTEIIAFLTEVQFHHQE